MKATFTTLTALAFLAGYNQAHAQEIATPIYNSSTKLAEYCESASVETIISFCGQYILGVQDTVAAMRVLGFLKEDQIRFCLPAQTSAAQLIGATKKYYLADPQIREKGRDLMAPVDVMTALVRSFPCAKK